MGFACTYIYSSPLWLKEVDVLFLFIHKSQDLNILIGKHKSTQEICCFSTADLDEHGVPGGFCGESPPGGLPELSGPDLET